MDAPLPAKAAAQAKQTLEQEETDCSICMEPIEGGQDYTKTPCNHIYHYSCFNKFSLSGTRYSCPTCRGALTDGDLARLRNAATGKIKQSNAPKAPIVGQAPADFLARVKNVFKPELPVIPVNEVTQKLMDTKKELQQIKEIRQELVSEKQDIIAEKIRLEENLRTEIARLIDKNKVLEKKLDEQKQSFEAKLQKMLKTNPDLAQIEALKASIIVLGQEKEKLEQANKQLEQSIRDLSNSLRNAQTERNNLVQEANNTIQSWQNRYTQQNLEIEKLIANAQKLTINYNDLERRYNYQERAANIYETRYQALRQRLVNISSWSIGAMSGYLAFKYSPYFPKTTAFFAGAAGLIGSWIYGTRYIERCHQQDLRDIQNGRRLS